MMLYSIASIGFFLFSLKKILRLVSIWQINGYKYARLRIYQRQQRRNLINRFLFPVFLLLGIGAFGFVVLDERNTLWYQLGATLFFSIVGLFSLRELKGRIFKRQKITFTAFAVTILSVAAVVVLYFTPLIDQFVWLFLLALFLPVFVMVFVWLFAFPTEIVADMLMQRAKKKIDSLSHTKVVLIQGANDKYQIKQYIVQLLSPYFEIITNKPEQETSYSLARIVRKQVSKETDIVLFTIQTVDNDSVDRIVDMLHPHTVILSSIPKAYEDYPKEKKKYLQTQQYFIDALPRNSVVLMNGENEDFLELSEHVKKVTLLYGSENSPAVKQFAILGFDIHVRKDGLWFGFKIGRKKRAYKTKLHTRKSLLTALPAIFLAHVFHIPQEEIEVVAKQLGKPAGRKITSRKNGKK